MCDAALKKWLGLRAAELKRHDVRAAYGAVRSRRSLNSDSDWYVACHCHFCNRYDSDCVRCPLFVVRGEACSLPHGESPWEDWSSNGNPEPMIRLLRKARKMLIAEAEKRKK